jgi:hypothetical protein
VTTAGVQLRLAEGKPYYLNDRGRKKYAYHPQPERDLCIGVESPHLCLHCGKRFDVDSRAPMTVCPACKSSETADTFCLESKACPDCKSGVFHRDPEYYCIS